MRNPKILEEVDPPPSDVSIVPTVSVIGKTKTGKTTLAKNLCARLGLVYVSIENII